jgi:hypothetical protein
MIQQGVIVVLFGGALFFVGRLVYRAFHAKTGCSTGCAKCSGVDFNKIEQQLKEKGI